MCRRIGVAEDGRPYCVHGPMWKHGHGEWSCADRKRKSGMRYDRCAVCDQLFGSEVAGSGRPPKFCGEDCRIEGLRRWRRANYKPKPRIPKVRIDKRCPTCDQGFWFMGTGRERRARKYCCRKCQNWARLGRRYGLSPHEYFLAMHTRQCEGCLEPFRQGERRQLDHCHVSEERGVLVARGVLHIGCNLSLGHMKSNPRLLRNLARYAEERCAEEASSLAA